MADQQNRGGKKVGPAQEGQSTQQQHVKPPDERPPEGQPGGPKQAPKSGRSEKSSKEE